MGTGFHLYAERLIDDKWYTLDEWQTELLESGGSYLEQKTQWYIGGRNQIVYYELMQGKYFPELKPKGVPIDCCREIRERMVEASEYHSHSYITLAELEAIDFNKPVIYAYGTAGMLDYLEYKAGKFPRTRLYIHNGYYLMYDADCINNTDPRPIKEDQVDNWLDNLKFDGVENPKEEIANWISAGDYKTYIRDFQKIELTIEEFRKTPIAKLLYYLLYNSQRVLIDWQVSLAEYGKEFFVDCINKLREYCNNNGIVDSSSVRFVYYFDN